MWGCRAGLRPFLAGGNPGRVPGRGDFKQRTQSSTSLALRPLGDFLNTTWLRGSALPWKPGRAPARAASLRDQGQVPPISRHLQNRAREDRRTHSTGIFQL